MRLQHACLCNIRIYFCNIWIKNLQHTSETDETFGTNTWKHHCNMCNIPIYFYNIDIKYLQHTSETIETSACNMQFQRNISLLLGRMDPCRHVEFYPGRCGLHTCKFCFDHGELDRRARDVHGWAPPRLPWAAHGWAPHPSRNELGRQRRRSS